MRHCLSLSADNSALKFDTTTSLMNEVLPHVGKRNCMRSPSLARRAKAARKHRGPRAVPLPPYLDAIKISASRIPARPIYHSENTRTANLSSAALSPRSGMPITLVSRYNEISRGFQFHVYLLLDSEVPFHLCLPYNLCLEIYVRILTLKKHEK